MKLVLIGFATSGKTTIGKLVANTLALDFVDVDERIERCGQSVADIFANGGEQSFRQKENAVLEKLKNCNDIVIACGGGSVLCDNFAVLAQDAIVIWLKVKPQTVLTRLGNVDRPLFDGKTEQELQSLVEQRNGLYAKFADVIVCTDNLTPQQIAKTIICG